MAFPGRLHPLGILLTGLLMATDEQLVGRSLYLEGIAGDYPA